MAIDRDTSRRGVGSIKLMLGGLIILLVIGIPLMMAISGSGDGGQPMEGGGTPTVTTPPTPSGGS